MLTDSLKDRLRSIAVATLTDQLQKRGIRTTFFAGLKALNPQLRLVGRARTLRYVALREDAANLYRGPHNAQRELVENVSVDDVIVIEARQVADAGTIGDLLASRAFSRGAAGIVTDGALRDTPALRDLGKPVYYQASHGSTWARHHMPLSHDEPITCAGVFVMPGDIIVGDAEGAVVLPVALAEEVAADAELQEEKEQFAIERVQAGAPTYDLFPLSEALLTDFQMWRARNSANPRGPMSPRIRDDFGGS